MHLNNRENVFRYESFCFNFSPKNTSYFHLFILTKTPPIVISYFLLYFLHFFMFIMSMIHIFYYICYRYARMSPERFYCLVELVTPHIAKKSFRSRNVIPEAERLFSTLRYLASGELQQSLSLNFRIGKSSKFFLNLEKCRGI